MKKIFSFLKFDSLAARIIFFMILLQLSSVVGGLYYYYNSDAEDGSGCIDAPCIIAELEYNFLDVEQNAQTDQDLRNILAEFVAVQQADFPNAWYYISRNDLVIAHGDVPPPELFEPYKSFLNLQTAISGSHGRSLGEPVITLLTSPEGETGFIEATGQLAYLTEPNLFIAVGNVVPETIENFSQFTAVFFEDNGLSEWLIFVAGLMLLTPLLTKLLMKKLSKATKQINKLSAENLHQRLSEEHVYPEIRPFFAAVNNAFDRIEMAVSRQQKFSAAAAHELRTPLAIIRAHIDILPETAAKDQLIEDVFSMNKIIGQLLMLAQLQVVQKDTETLDLVQITKSIIADLAPQVLNQNKQISLDIETNKLDVVGHETLLRCAIINVIENAVKFSADGGDIAVRISANAQLVVANKGTYIPQQENDSIFEPFVRLAVETKGYGIGLALVHEIIKIHDCSVSVISEKNNQTEFRLSFKNIMVK